MHKTSLKNPRVVRFEIDSILVDGQCGQELLFELRREYAWAATQMVAAWRNWHFEHGTAEKIHRREKTGPAFPGELKKRLYHVGKAAAPRINPTSIQWLNQWLIRTLSEQTSAKHNRKKWCAIIHGDEDGPSFDYLPLRVYDSFATVTVEGRELSIDAKLVKNDEGKYRQLRLKIVNESITGGKKAVDFREKRLALRLIADGARRMPCSQIIYERGKFYFALTVDRAVEPIDVIPDTTLFLRTSRRAMLRCRFVSQSLHFGADRLAALGAARRRLRTSRRRRSRWREFCKTLNYQVASELAAAIRRHRVARVVVLDGSLRSAVNVCGLDGDEVRGGYPIQQLRTFLKQKLEPLGVEVVERANLRSVKRRIARSSRNLRMGRVQEVGV